MVYLPQTRGSLRRAGETPHASGASASVRGRARRGGDLPPLPPPPPEPEPEPPPPPPPPLPPRPARRLPRPRRRPPSPRRRRGRPLRGAHLPAPQLRVRHRQAPARDRQRRGMGGGRGVPLRAGHALRRAPRRPGGRRARPRRHGLPQPRARGLLRGQHCRFHPSPGANPWPFAVAPFFCTHISQFTKYNENIVRIPTS